MIDDNGVISGLVKRLLITVLVIVAAGSFLIIFSHARIYVGLLVGLGAGVMNFLISERVLRSFLSGEVNAGRGVLYFAVYIFKLAVFAGILFLLFRMDISLEYFWGGAIGLIAVPVINAFLGALVMKKKMGGNGQPDGRT